MYAMSSRYTKKPPPAKKPEPRDTALSLRIKRTVRDAIAQAAIDDGRSSSALVERVMTDWLRTKGYLK
jgi:hypothetical protein